MIADEFIRGGTATGVVEFRAGIVLSLALWERAGVRGNLSGNRQGVECPVLR